METNYKNICNWLFAVTLAIMLFSGCKKQDDWLNVKNKKSDVSPQTLQDFQAVLDNITVFNSYGSVLGLVGTDNIYVPDANLDGETTIDRNAYLWAKDIYEGQPAPDWSYEYQAVEYANIVIEGLNKLSNTDISSISGQNIKGEALFCRAYAYYQLCQLYCKPYSKATAATDLGVPIRLITDINQKVGRAAVQQCYDQMISDLKSSVAFLPASALYKTRPSSGAAMALLAKIYLAMADYTNAYQYADLALKSNNSLLDYNTLSPTSSAPFPTFAKGNSEIIYYAYTYGCTIAWYNGSVTGRITPDLYNTYANGDLRKTLFFVADGNGYFRPKAGYAAKANNFCGIANNEIYLIRAESAVRTGNVQVALADLNALLKKRFTTATFTTVTITDPQALLTTILLERRKELPLTGNLRWEDLRRLNLESGSGVTLHRTYHNTTYTLTSGDNRYVLPIPSDEITLEDLQQNPR
ncbi:SusD family protein [Mucilaginibacter pineti]|uniref:SusD family protein n=1 Tax=Mucilaginibacter pineti TaxID=1391627 RepID=A0A1G7JNW6_9SPHI|nr:RagB/SusD family nutrient uptake outer membrane protein [Mucilaginibacter pineti]SDF26603.1 SusD family protein [Mucilaginibacter pineti]